jgi:uncharacterized delta-60 repeat protein
MSAKSKVTPAPYYVAVGPSVGGSMPAPNSISYSSDGITWSSSVLPSGTSGFGKVVFGKDKFVAITANDTNQAAYSTDGINWTATTLPSAGSWNSLSYGGGKFVAIRSSSNVAAYSTDGITWTETTLPASGTWLSVTYGDGKFVAIARSLSTNAYSTDGITWSAGSMPSGASWQEVAYGSGKFVALINDSTSFAYSTNGSTWTLGFMPYSFENWISIGYGNGKFVALVGNSSKSAYSLDGVSWTASSMPSAQFWSAITYGNGKFVALAVQSTTTAYSTDGITWSTSNSIAPAASWRSISYGAVWRDVTTPYVKVAGAWKVAKSAFIKIGGQWKNWFLQGGLNDDTFNQLDNLSAFNNEISDMAIQPDGKIVFAGRFTSFNAKLVNRIARLNTDGTLDSEFRNNTGTGAQGSNEQATSLAIQSDGKILVGGQFETFNNVATGSLIRLNSNGTIDTDFLSNIGSAIPYGNIPSIAVQPDGKILVGGGFPSFNNISANGLVRLNSNGTMDTAFNSAIGSGFPNTVKKILVLPNGQILIAGLFTTFNGAGANRIVMLNQDGTRNTLFNTNLGSAAGGEIEDLAIQSDGKIVIVGFFTTFNNVTARRIARINSDGTLDTNFVSNTGTGFNSIANTIEIQPDGKILVGGGFTSFNENESPRIARLNSDGTRDSNFSTNVGTGSNGEVNRLKNIPGGKILVGGFFTTFNGELVNNVTALNSSGTIDPFPGLPFGANGLVLEVAIQGNNQIIVGGNFTKFNNVLSSGIARLLPDGTLDSVFTNNIGQGATGGFGGVPGVISLAIQSSGHILVGGSFTSFSGFSANGIVRLNPNGTRDSGFFNSGLSRAARSIVIQPDGKILIGGDFTSFNNVASNGIVRLNSDGTRDTVFNNNLGTAAVSNTYINQILLQPDGKILIVGGFSVFNGVNIKNFARLNSDGTLDTAFNNVLGTGPDSFVSSIALQSDGKILLGGFFSNFNGVSSRGLVRLNADGTRDANFGTNIGTGTFSQNVEAITVSSDGKILLGGDFGFFNGIRADKLIRLNSDGTVDQQFVTNASPQFGLSFSIQVRVTTLKSLPSGKVVVGGQFTGFGEAPRNSLAIIGGELAY